MVNRIFYIIVSLSFIVYIYKQVKKKKLSEKESILWMLGATFFCILGIFPNILDALAKCLNIAYPPSLLFLIGIMFGLALIFRAGVYVSVLQSQVKELAELNAVLQKRILEIEEKLKASADEKI